MHDPAIYFVRHHAILHPTQKDGLIYLHGLFVWMDSARCDSQFDFYVMKLMWSRFYIQNTI